MDIKQMVTDNILTIISFCLSIGVSWGIIQSRVGALQSQVRDLEKDNDKRVANDLIVVEKLTKLETQMQYVYSKAIKDEGKTRK